MNSRSLKQRLLRTRIALKQTLNRILDINRKRKALNELVEFKEHSAKLEDELKVLNHLASNQASLVRKYENDLAVSDAWSNQFNSSIQRTNRATFIRR